MVEIYNYSPDVHEKFAREQREVEAFRKQYQVGPTSGQSAASTRILDFIPKHPQMELLLQSYVRKSWATIEIPHNYNAQHFSSSFVAPSLGSSERQDADIAKITTLLERKTRGRFSKNQESEDPDEKEMIQEGQILINLLEKGVKETNSMVSEVLARMLQFLQG